MSDESRIFSVQQDDRPGTPGHSPTRSIEEPERIVPMVTPQRVVVSSTFTAEPLRDPMELWMRILDIEAEIVFAPYAQVMQALLDPDSELGQNARGFNLLLIRPEDWIGEVYLDTDEERLGRLERAANNLVAAVGVNRANASAQMLVFLCPPSSASPAQSELEALQERLAVELRRLTRVFCWTNKDLERLYPLRNIEDTRAFRIGHIPYTREYYVAIATFLVRRMTGLMCPKHKVIAVDCDNTLWGGICGEEDAATLELTQAHIEFQRTLVRQHDAGVLLCICSKNNTDDVANVFTTRGDMPLRGDHLICSRTNWKPKSENLASIAAELNLSLDAFIFIDDDPLECAEVRTNCPSVLTLQFPKTPEEIVHFTDHMWVFDRDSATSEAKQRTSQYRQNRARAKALEEASDLQSFIASLDLQVKTARATAEQLGRISELTQRTNQFNLSTVRYSPSEIEAHFKFGVLKMLSVDVQDRFGKYGLTGAVLYRETDTSIDVDTFLLSCRILGRGVEYEILNELGRIARRRGVDTVLLRYRKTERNAPARGFVESLLARLHRVQEIEDHSECAEFAIPASYAETAGPEIIQAKAVPKPFVPQESEPPPNASTYPRWYEVPYKLSRIPDIMAEMLRRKARSVRPITIGSVPKSSSAEHTIAKMWSAVLGDPVIEVDANFFELGGDSILAAQLLATIWSVFGVEVPLHEFALEPTIAQLSCRLARTLPDERGLHPTVAPIGED